MPIPTLVFGIFLSTLYAAIYHLLRGGGKKMMLVFLGLAWAGFWLGDAFAWAMGWYFIGVGNLNAGTATIGCFLFLIIGDLGRFLRNKFMPA